MQAIEGYYKRGAFYAVKPPVNVSENRRVIITILDDSMIEKHDTWAELDKIIAEMNEKPVMEDFPRIHLDRELIDFNDRNGGKL